MRSLLIALCLLFTQAGSALAQASSGAAFEGLVIGFNADWKPYSYQTADGAAAGLLVDEVRRLMKRIGVEARYVAYPWKRVQVNVAEGTIDAFVTVPTDERLAYAVSTRKTVFSVPMKSFVNKFNPRLDELLKIRAVPEFRGFRVCDLIGNGWAERTYREHGVQVEFLTRTENCVRQVHLGRADLMLIAEEVGKSIIADEKLDDKVVVLPTIHNQMDFTFLVSRKSPHQAIVGWIDRN